MPSLFEGPARVVPALPSFVRVVVEVGGDEISLIEMAYDPTTACALYLCGEAAQTGLTLSPRRAHRAILFAQHGREEGEDLRSILRRLDILPRFAVDTMHRYDLFAAVLHEVKTTTSFCVDHLD